MNLLFSNSFFFSFIIMDKITILFLGPSKCGKTALCKTFISEEGVIVDVDSISPTSSVDVHHTTRVLEDVERSIDLVDPSGAPILAEATDMLVRSKFAADGVIYVFSTQEKRQFPAHVMHSYQQVALRPGIMGIKYGRKVPALLLGTRVGDGERKITSEEAAYVANTMDMEYKEVGLEDAETTKKVIDDFIRTAFDAKKRNPYFAPKQ